MDNDKTLDRILFVSLNNYIKNKDEYTYAMLLDTLTTCMEVSYFNFSYSTVYILFYLYYKSIDLITDIRLTGYIEGVLHHFFINALDSRKSEIETALQEIHLKDESIYNIFNHFG